MLPEEIPDGSSIACPGLTFRTQHCSNRFPLKTGLNLPRPHSNAPPPHYAGGAPHNHISLRQHPQPNRNLEETPALLPNEMPRVGSMCRGRPRLEVPLLLTRTPRLFMACFWVKHLPSSSVVFSSPPSVSKSFKEAALGEILYLAAALTRAQHLFVWGLPAGTRALSTYHRMGRGSSAGLQANAKSPSHKSKRVLEKALTT